MKLAIIGSRTITNSLTVFSAIEDWRKKHVPVHLVVLAGGAVGVDDYANRWAVANGIDFVLFKPYFMLDSKATYNPRHYFIRNKQLVQNSDHVLAIWDGESKGTEFGISYAKKHRKPITIVRV